MSFKVSDIPRLLFLPKPPAWLIIIAIISVIASWLPLAAIMRSRVSYKTEPRVHIFQDMDNQAKYKAQSAAAIFADGRSMRMPIPGTVARGQLDLDDHYHRGFELVPIEDQPGKWTTVYFDSMPKQVRVDERLIRHGQERYNIHCAPCHGYDGKGEGMVHQRAAALGEPSWVPPTNLHTDQVRHRPDGHLFNTITNGIRNMAPYGHQVPVADRWAIVAYIRALQLSQNMDYDQLTPAQRQKLPQ